MLENTVVSLGTQNTGSEGKRKSNPEIIRGMQCTGSMEQKECMIMRADLVKLYI